MSRLWIPALLLVMACAVPDALPDEASDGTSDGAEGPAAALGFMEGEIVRSLDDCEPAAEGCTYALFRYPIVVSAAGETAAVEAINAFIEGLLQDTVGDTRASPEAVAQRLVDEYRGYSDEFPEADIPWVLEREVSVVHAADDVLSLALDEYSYTGGAHPNSMLSYWVLDLETGSLVGLDEFFLPGFMPELTRLGEASFRAARGLAADASLEAEGFWFDDGVFELNENFAVTGEGITFRFNPYEVTAYAFGPTDFSLARRDLSEIARPDGPLAPRR